MGTKELEKKSSGGGLVAAWKQNPLVSTGLVLILMIVVQTAIMIYNFGEGSVGELMLSLLTNWLNILRNNAPVGIIALGMTFVIISGGIDLSVGSTLVAVGAMVMMVVDGSATGLLAGMGITGVPAYIIAIAVGLVFGALLGWLNGVLIAHGKLPPFIATLGTMQIFRSVTQHLTQHANPSVPKGFLQIANLKIGSFYIMPILYWLAIAAVLYVVSKRTTFGRHVFAVGSNIRTARLSGINVNKVKRRIYMLTGMLVAIAAIIQVSRIGSMDYASAGSGYEMDAIAAVIVGGTSMSGGKGSIVGTVLGMLIIGVMNNFFVSHYVFRWRTAMNEHYMAHWQHLRHIEGAAQRVQEDTMRFASTLENMGVSFINAIMTLIAFLPVLVTLSEHVPDLPIVGHLPYGLVIAAIVWSLMGTGLLAVVGIKLPGLEFKNQRVEAAYRKELVYGEDDETRATPPTVRELFRAVRRNYFRLYFHYMYFNIARILYLQVDNVFGLFLLFPSIVAGTITLGLMTQITNVFGQVRGAFQYLINSWTTLVELMSIYKRLRSFEHELDGDKIQEVTHTLS